MQEGLKPLTVYEREYLEDELKRAENSLAIELEMEPGSHAACFKLATTIKALKAALTRPADSPKAAKVEDEYEGDTAKGWYEAWTRENDAWQKMVQHHEELEDAVKILIEGAFNATVDTELTVYTEHLEAVRQIIEVEGSAPAALQPKPEAKEGAVAIARAQGMHVGLCQQGMTRWDAMKRVRETFEKWYPTEHFIIKELPDDRFF